MDTNVIHIIDNLDAGGAQEIVYSVVRYSPNIASSVVTMHRSHNPAYIPRLAPFARVRRLADSKYNIMAILWRIFILILGNRKQAFFNAHLEASILTLCLMRFFFRFRCVVSVYHHPGQFPPWKNALMFRAMRYADACIVADRDAEAMAKRYRAAHGHIHFIPIGTERIKRVDAVDKDIRAELGIESSQRILLNIARMVPPKGQRDLIIMMDMLREKFNRHDFHLIIIGDGPEFMNLTNLIDSHRLNDCVTLTGKRTDLHNFYPKADWFIMPSYDESMGVVIYEALGYVLPVVAYNSGSIGEILREDFGVLLPCSPGKLAETIHTTSSETFRTKLRAADLSYYSAERMARDYEKVYESLTP